MAPEQGQKDDSSTTTNATAGTAENNGATALGATAPSAGDQINTKPASTTGTIPKGTSQSLEFPRQPGRSASPRRIKTSWVGFLTKRELETYLVECGLDPGGVVEELRRRLTIFINSGSYTGEHRQKLLEWEQNHTPRTNSHDNNKGDTNSHTTVSPNQQLTQGHSNNDIAQVVGTWPHYEPVIIDDRTFKKVRKWGLKFDGEADSIDFIERIEELALSQGIPLDQIPVTLSESMTGDALAWWRNRRHTWGNWTAFKVALLEHFLPGNYWDDLEDTIRARKQTSNEPFKKYVLALETLMRHANMTQEEKLARIYKNSLPALRMLIKREEFTSLEKLTRLVTHIEVARDPVYDKQPQSRQLPALTPDEVTNPVTTTHHH